MPREQESTDLNEPDLLEPDQVAERLRVSTMTLSRWRREGRGPSFVAIGLRCVRYRKTVIDKYIADGEVRSTAEKHSKNLKARAREEAECYAKERRTKKSSTDA